MLVRAGARVDPEQNPVIRLFRRLHAGHAASCTGSASSCGSTAGWHATPLLVALLFLEMSDIIFAVDSVPAIFALTREPLIVFTSNVFAILGLRAMYFLLAGAIERFHLLKYALALILIFVGLKMVWLNDAFGGKFPIGGRSDHRRAARGVDPRLDRSAALWLAGLGGFSRRAGYIASPRGTRAGRAGEVHDLDVGRGDGAGRGRCRPRAQSAPLRRSPPG